MVIPLNGWSTIYTFTCSGSAFHLSFVSLSWMEDVSDVLHLPLSAHSATYFLWTIVYCRCLFSIQCCSWPLSRNSHLLWASRSGECIGGGVWRTGCSWVLVIIVLLLKGGSFEKSKLLKLQTSDDVVVCFKHVSLPELLGVLQFKCCYSFRTRWY